MLAMSVDQFCAAFNLGRDSFYSLLKQGIGPQCMMIGTRRLITVEAAQKWAREREEAAAA
jgi:hypothetical protein